MAALLIYLDQNHWIGLAKARRGKPDGLLLKPVLDHLIEADRMGRAEFVTSLTVYGEQSMNMNYRQRADVAEVIELLSHFRAFPSQTDVLREEIDLALLKHFGVPSEPRRLAPTGRGVGFASTGRELRARLNYLEPVIEPRSAEELRVLEEHLTLLAERRMLIGPTDEEKATMSNYRPDRAHAVTEARAAREAELASMLSPEDRRPDRLSTLLLLASITMKSGQR